VVENKIKMRGEVKSNRHIVQTMGRHVVPRLNKCVTKHGGGNNESRTNLTDQTIEGKKLGNLLEEPRKNSEYTSNFR
jgi:hypothetical protein